MYKISITYRLVIALQIICLSLNAWIAIWPDPARTVVETTTASPPEELIALRRAGFAATYNLDYKTAREKFEEISKRWPYHPSGDLYLANITWLEYLHRMRLLQMGLYRSKSFYARTGKVSGTTDRSDTVAPEVDRIFRERTEAAKTKAMALVNRDRNDPFAHYFLGAVYGSIASYEASTARKYLSAIQNGMRSVECHRHALRLKTDLIESYLTIGLFDYVVGTLPFGFRALAAIGGIRGNKERGILELKQVVERRAENADDARVLLTAIYQTEGQPQEALKILGDLTARFPRNYLFKLETASLLSQLNRSNEADAIYDELMQIASREESSPYAADLISYFDLHTQARPGLKDSFRLGRPTTSALQSSAKATIAVDELLALMPAMDMVAVIDGKALNDRLPRLAGFNLGGLNHLAKSIQEFAGKTGIDSSKVENVVLGVDMSRTLAINTVIIQGDDIDDKKLEAAMKAHNTEHKTTTYKGKLIFNILLEPKSLSAGIFSVKTANMAIAPLGEQKIALGELSEVKGIIDIQSGSAKGGVTSVMSRALKETRESALIRFALNIPENLRQDALHEGDLLKSVAAIQVIMGTFDIASDLSLSLDLLLKTPSENDATKLKNGLGDIISLTRGFISGGDPKSDLSGQLLDRITISTNLTDVSLAVTLSRTVMDQLMEKGQRN